MHWEIILQSNLTACCLTVMVWMICYRGGGGGGKKWYHDGRCTGKHNSIKDYLSCAEFLIEKGIVQENKLAGWGFSAGGLLVASAINCCPDLFRAAILKVCMSNESTWMLLSLSFFLLHSFLSDCFDQMESTVLSRKVLYKKCLLYPKKANGTEVEHLHVYSSCKEAM